MKYYICCFGVSVESAGFDSLRERFTNKFYELRSYWELQKFSGHSLRVYGNEYFMDSGAFSARMRGIDIGVEEYGNFIKKHQKSIHHFANLDAIPRSTSTEDMIEGAHRTWQNQKILEEITGLVPLPVYHKGEPIEFFERYLKEYEYICVGGLMNESCTNRVFFDMVWQMNRKKGKPWRKLHAFGVSNIPHLKRYSWHSSDSSAWLRSATCGVIVVPVQDRKGNYDFLQRPIICPISDKATARSNYKKRHFDFLFKEDQLYVLNYLESLNLTLGEMRGLNLGRMAVNMHWWLEFNKAYNASVRPKNTKQIFLL
jgi:hypothetical protein